MLDIRPDVKAGPIMMRSNADLPHTNDELVAHRTTIMVYRKSPAHKVQVVVPSASIPSPQSAVIRTLRPTRPSLKTVSEIFKAYGQRDNTDNEAAWCLQRHFRLDYEGNQPRDRSLHATHFNKNVNQDTHYANDESKNITPAVVRIHRGFYAAHFEYGGEEEDSLCDDSDIKGLDSKAATRWIICDLESLQDHQLTTTQLLMQENVLRNIVEQALKARRNGRVDSSIFSEEMPEEEDKGLEISLEMMKLGPSMIDAGILQGEEGGDIQMMVRNTFHTLMRKATRPLRPSGIRL